MEEVEFLGYQEEKNFLRSSFGGCHFVESFTDYIKLKRFSSKVPSLSIPPWKMSNPIFSKSL